MAWNSREEEAMARIFEHLDVFECYTRWNFLMAVNHEVFPREGEIGAHTLWITRQNVT